MSGTVEADEMRGLEGDDVIRASEDNDRLVGGVGNDRLSGNAGDDRYVFADGWGKDTIVSDVSGLHDKVRFFNTTTGVKIALDN
jgi:Ca2+-binding RTX toxin-like protein